MLTSMALLISTVLSNIYGAVGHTNYLIDDEQASKRDELDCVRHHSISKD